MPPAQQKILIVDDDADFRQSLGFFLESQGYAVRQATDARQGLLLARLERPDLIIMDLMMSERTEGLFAIQELRRSADLPKTPIFVISSLYAKVPDFQVPPDSAWLGHDEFFPKPVDLPRLLEAIRRRLSTQTPSETNKP
ncbi:MAG: response regulator [candidate division WOR-3 bacterium]